jgi:hypothetical protein
VSGDCIQQLLDRIATLTEQNGELATNYVGLLDSLAAERAEVERLRVQNRFLGEQGAIAHANWKAQCAEVERLRKRLQACQSADASPLTDDCITQNERFLLAENERLRGELADERALADQLASHLKSSEPITTTEVAGVDSAAVRVATAELRAEITRLRAAGDALAEAVGDDDGDPWILATFEAWQEARRER